MRRSSVTTFGLLASLLLIGSASALDYRVKAGDSLNAIAARFGVTVDQLRSANGISGSTIHVGQVLTIPGDAKVHVVRQGEALWEIALKYRVTAAEIMRANDLSSDLIHPGDRLNIPAAATSGGSSGAGSAGGGGADGTTHSVSQQELEVLARIIKGECPPDVPWEGKVAVAAVVLNRVERPGYPKSVAGVAHQPLQFSCYNADVRDRLYRGAIPQWAWDAARAAVNGEDPSRGATHYFNPYLVQPGWAANMKFLRRIGHDANTTHDFYR